MIISSLTRLVIGAIYQNNHPFGGLSDHKAEYHQIPFKVIRAASREEFLKQCKEYEIPEDWISGPEALVNHEACLFYEVQMD